MANEVSLLFDFSAAFMIPFKYTLAVKPRIDLNGRLKWQSADMTENFSNSNGVIGFSQQNMVIISLHDNHLIPEFR
jgi:hypothetical protein